MDRSDAASEAADALAFAAAAENVALPLLLCDPRGQVLRASRGAEALCARERVLAVQDGRLVVGEQRQKTLLGLLQRAASGEAPEPRASELLLKLDRNERMPLSLMVSAIPDFPDRITVYVHEPAFTARISEPLLCRLYDLTAAEARVARLLVNGESVRNIADLNATSPHTVRNQVKNIFAKTGAKRQAELAILLLAGPAHSR